MAGDAHGEEAKESRKPRKTTGKSKRKKTVADE